MYHKSIDFANNLPQKISFFAMQTIKNLQKYRFIACEKIHVMLE
jgi:hypothetical protein